MKNFTLLLALLLIVFSCANDDSMTTVIEPKVIAEFKPNLSELNLYAGNLSDLNISPYAIPYDLSTPLFTDYAHKERLIVLPDNSAMEFDGDGLPIFPEKTLIAKTFYYNLDERDVSLGRQIIETRILIKINGEWEMGDYKWNEDQTDAILEPTGSALPVSWIDADGNSRTTTYEIPSSTDCFTCHNTFENVTPIGPKLMSLNFQSNGSNQLQDLVDDNKLTGVTDLLGVRAIPNWADTTLPLETRARAYLDINCAHCHIPGGYCDDQSTLDLAFKTPLSETNIIERKASILYRISDYNSGISMPFIGTTMIHAEGVTLIQDYLDTL